MAFSAKYKPESINDDRITPGFLLPYVICACIYIRNHNILSLLYAISTPQNVIKAPY